MSEINVDLDAVPTTIVELVSALRAGDLTPARAGELLDQLIDTGRWDELDEPIYLAIVAILATLIPDPSIDLVDMLRRDPANMRARADRVEDHNPERAARIRARADRVEARRG